MPAPRRTLDPVGAAALAISEAVWGAFPPERSDAAALNLVTADPGLSVSSLARNLGLSHSATVRVVDRLERERLLTRSVPGPGRTLALNATKLGRSRARQAANRRARILKRATTGLSARERETLIDLLCATARSLARDQDEIDRACRLCDQRRCLRSDCPLPT